MALPWRVCRCGHLVQAHRFYMTGPMRCLDECPCREFKDRSLWQWVRWTVWRLVRV